jgi:uncharacterized membrane protein
MPYQWTTEPHHPTALELHLWPHNSLPPKGFAAMVLSFYLFATIPLYPLLGTLVFWGILPFMLAATAALYYALQRNRKDRQIHEVLTLTQARTRLERDNPRGPRQEWESNTYWVRVALHPEGGPVPNYVTLSGNGREVEIGAFLSEDERKALYSELRDCLRRFAGA